MPNTWFRNIQMGDYVVPDPTWNLYARPDQKLPEDKVEVQGLLQSLHCKVPVAIAVDSTHGVRVILGIEYFLGRYTTPVYEIPANHRDSIADFVATNNRGLSKYHSITDEYYAIMLRKSRRYVESSEDFVSAIDLVSIDIAECSQRQGIFRAYVQFLESFGKSVYIECIHNPIIVSAAKRWGYSEVNTVPVSMIKIQGDT